MNCQDAREAYSHGDTALTERALVHAHVMQCTECQKEWASLPLLANARHRVASFLPARLPQLRQLLTMSSTVSEQAAVKMLDGARSGATRAGDLLGRVRGLGSDVVKLGERTAASAIGALRFATAIAVGLLSGLHAALSVSASVTARVVATGARVGVTWIVDVLARMRGLVSVCVTVSERAAAGAIAATRFAMDTFVELLIHLRRLLAISLTALGRAAVWGSEGARVRAMRVGYLLVQLRGLLSVFVKRSVVETIVAARSGMTRTGHLLIRLRGPVATSLTVSGQATGRTIEVARAAAPVIGRAGFAMTRMAYRALQGTAQAATEVGRAGMTRGRDSLTRVRAWLSTSVTGSGQAAGRLIAASRAGVVRLRGPLAQAGALGWLLVARSERVAARTIAATWTAGRAVVAPPAHVRPILKACIGIASFAILVAALLASWPRPWRPDPVMAEREVRRAVELTPVGPATAPYPVQTAAPEAVSSPQRAPVVVSPPDTPRMATRPRPSEARAEIPAPERRSAASSAPSPSTEAVQSGDAADSTAAIDWLLKGGGSRRRVESP